MLIQFVRRVPKSFNLGIVNVLCIRKSVKISGFFAFLSFYTYYFFLKFVSNRNRLEPYNLVKNKHCGTV